jgi:PKD repeat protein
MLPFRAYLPVLILICVCHQAQAQDYDRYSILSLKSGQKTLPEQYVAPGFFTDNTHYDYRYLQFYQLPNQYEQQRLKQAGIELLSYISAQTYIAAFTPDTNFSVLYEQNIRSIHPIEPTEKISPDIDQLIDTRQNFSVQFHENISPETAYCLLDQYGLSPKKRYTDRPIFQIESTYDLILHLVKNPAILFVELAPQRSTEDLSGNIQHYSNVLSSSSSSLLPLDGTGVNIAIGDDGFVGPHIDFSGRIIENSQSYNLDESHGDMVAGILSGAGNLNPQIRGVAPGASLCILKDFEAVEKASELYENKGVVLTSTSYGDGCNRGYTTFTQLVDEQINIHPSLMHVFSAGNAGTQDCGYGAGAGWGNITGGVKVGKNVIAVGNLKPNDEIVENSSRGPANDGRIKPDLCARGDGQISTAPNNSFQFSSGSSAAAPIVTGILAQLYQAYREMHNGANPSSDLMKAILLNSADDLGNPGPDYTYGWGKINALNAFQTLEENRYINTSITNDQVLNLDLNVPNNVQQLKLMIYWHDHKGSTVSSKSLVNDLDCWIEKNDIPYYPLTLNPTNTPSSLNQIAQPGIDHVNNMEQIVIDNPPSGNYDLLIHGFNVPYGPQEFIVTYEFIQEHLILTHPHGNEKLNSGAPIRIQWDANTDVTPFELEFSDDLGENWTPITSVNGNQTFYDWSLPEINSPKAFVRIKRDDLQSLNSSPFHIYTPPTGLQVSSVCSDYLTLEWEPVSDAVRYVIYTLDGIAMDSLTSTDENSIDIPIDNPDQVHWFAVSAEGPDQLQSMRTNAVSDGIGLKNCMLQYDVRPSAIVSPSTHLIQNCFQEATTVTINLKNEGTTTIENFQVYYQYDNLLPVAETYQGTIPSGITVNHTFSLPLDLGAIGPHRLQVWSAMDNDQGLYNDTLSFELRVLPSTQYSLPYIETFDNFIFCQTSSNCEGQCLLSADWTNADNGLSDQIDWLPYAGSTSTLGTGPDRDQNNTSDTGKYLYLEPGEGCFNEEAILYSPCINLDNSIAPSLIFWYHMKGSNMGTLQLDLFDGNDWWNNLIPPITLNQVDQWQKVNVDLSAFSGNIISLRFRGTTGDGVLSDLALDNISVIESATPPVADFTLDHTETCPNQTVQLIDNSYNEPTSWSWNISPGTFSFLDGSSANSQYPLLSFHQPGTYSIELTSSNNFGSDQIIKTDILKVSSGQIIPFIENFDSPITTSAWNLENPDADKTWESIEITGKSAETTQAIYINNHGYNAIGQEDAIRSNSIDLNNIERPYLRFDLSYAPFNQYFSDGLRIELSDDCQTTFEHVIFESSGLGLATAPAQMRGWTPKQTQDWRSIEIDLSTFIGQQIALRFVNICGFGNNMYLDNILIYEYEDFPHPAFQYNSIGSIVCIDEPIFFENLTEGTELDFFEWTFGENASPNLSYDENPVPVSFQATGNYEVSLKVSNDLGWDYFTRNIKVVDKPVAKFEYSTFGYTVDFKDQTSGEYNLIWDFGDGHQSTDKNPRHTYESAGLYTVSLTVENECGQTTDFTVISIKASTSGDNEFLWSSHPNPANDFIQLSVSSTTEPFVQFQLFDASAQILLERQLDTPFGVGELFLDISELPPGIYLLVATTDKKFEVKKIVIY